MWEMSVIILENKSSPVHLLNGSLDAYSLITY